MEIDTKLLLENSKDLSVLYVEDAQETREATQTLLANFFSHIQTAKDGEEGLEMYTHLLQTTNKAYDIVISDINMPKLNGIEMCQNIRKMQAQQAIILITAFNEPQYLNSAIQIGVGGFLVKPVTKKSLKDVLYLVTQSLADAKILEKHYAQIEELNMLHINQKDASTFTTSKDIYKDLKNSEENISQLWIEKDTVREKLEKHMIDLEFFRTHYALKVIEYFLGVISEENELGNCPVVFIMLDFFKNKNLPLNDIFMICVAFKNTISAYVFNKYSFNQKLFDDISIILDRNFEGVILKYLEVKSEKQEIVAQEVSSVEDVSKEYTEKDRRHEPREQVNYREYILDHDIYELQDLEEDIDSLAITITESHNSKVEDFSYLGDRINHYGKILANYPMFSELGGCIVKLGSNLSQNAQLLYDDNERMTNIAALIEGFVNDLIVWRREIFDNNTSTPHFLDQSFFSNVDTIIMCIEYDESAVTEEEDLDDMFF